MKNIPPLVARLAILFVIWGFLVPPLRYWFSQWQAFWDTGERLWQCSGC